MIARIAEVPSRKLLIATFCLFFACRFMVTHCSECLKLCQPPIHYQIQTFSAASFVG
jgi:hypothetical protein